MQLAQMLQLVMPTCTCKCPNSPSHYAVFKDTCNRCFPPGNACIAVGYGGGMSSAKAALESDTRVLAYEAGRKHQVRVNTISAGPLGSRAAKAIGFIDDMIR